MAKTLLKGTVKVEFYPENRMIIEFHDMRLRPNMLKTPKEKRILRDIRKIGWNVRLIQEYFPEVLPNNTYRTAKYTLAITDWNLMHDKCPNTIWISKNAMKRHSCHIKKRGGIPEDMAETMVHEMAHAIMFNNPVIRKRENNLRARIEKSHSLSESMHAKNEELKELKELNHGKTFQIIYSQLTEKHETLADSRYWRKFHKRDPLKNLK